MNIKIEQSFLVIALICLALVSALTTGYGVLIVLENEPDIIKLSSAIGIAIGTSTMMIYLGLKVKSSSPLKRWFGFFPAYMLVALISFFFNFCTFFSSQSKDTVLTEDIENSINIFSDLQQQLKFLPSEKHNISELESKVTTAEEGMRHELLKATDTGPGPRYKEHKIIFDENSPKLQALKKIVTGDESNLNNDTEEIFKSTNAIIDLIHGSENLEEKERLLIEFNNNIGMISSTFKSYNNQYKKPRTTAEFREVNKPSFSMNSILKYFSSGLEEQNRSRFTLAALIGFFLDFPIFLALMLTGGASKNKPIREEAKSTKSKTEEMNDFWT